MNRTLYGNLIFELSKKGRKGYSLPQDYDRTHTTAELPEALRRKEASNADLMNKAVLTESLMENIPQDVITILIQSIYDQREMTTMQRLNLRAMENK